MPEINRFYGIIVRMFPRNVDVSHDREYRSELAFSDGTSARIDFRDRIVGRGAVFLPLEDMDHLERVQVDPEISTLLWPNEVDSCPDVLYAEATGKPLPTLEPVHF